ncbi:DM13 domain-containing protein [Candidatus Leptofilum sp.]|uniref:DM13 domain-containing protein n=1 Tax=Candidatus Leptofilum sp. TaxID=3241576 RepID=UPI003B5C18CA
MSKNSKLLIGVLMAAVVLAASWYLASPLFITNSVDEAFPFEIPDATTLANMDTAEMAALEDEFMSAVPDEATIEQLSDEDRAMVEDQVMEAAAAVMADKEMDDAMPAAEWTVAASGTFLGADAFHEGEGTAVIFQQGEQRVLRLEDFRVTNGPDLHVILSKSTDPLGSGIGEDYLDLGQLKGNVGNQNYELPADLDLSEYQSVVIYCMPFHVLFSAASLSG